jgi:hypothetical protein
VSGILALDCAAATGWAYGTAGPEQWGTIHFTAKDRAAKWQAFREWLDGMIAAHSPDMLAYEKPFLRGAGSMSLIGYCVAVECAAHDHGLIVAPVHNATVKKHAGIKGADKPIAAARARGWDVQNSHEADAVWLLDYVANGLEADAAPDAA